MAATSGSPDTGPDGPNVFTTAVVAVVRLRLLRQVWAVTVACVGMAVLAGPPQGVGVTANDLPDGLIAAWGVAALVAAGGALLGSRAAILAGSALMGLWALEVAVLLNDSAAAAPGVAIGYTGLAACGLVLSTKDDL